MYVYPPPPMLNQLENPFDVCLLDSTMELFACLFFICSVLRYYRTPPRFDSRLAREVVQMLPYAAVLHLLLAMWFFSSPMQRSVSVTSMCLLDRLPRVYTLCNFRPWSFRFRDVPLLFDVISSECTINIIGCISCVHV